MALDEQILKVPGIVGIVWFQAPDIEVQLQCGFSLNTAKQGSHLVFRMPRLPCLGLVWLQWAGCEPLPLYLPVVPLGFSSFVLVQHRWMSSPKSLSVGSQQPELGLMWLTVFPEESRAGNMLFSLCLLCCNSLQLPCKKRLLSGGWTLVQHYTTSGTHKCHLLGKTDFGNSKTSQLQWWPANLAACFHGVKQVFTQKFSS